VLADDRPTPEPADVAAAVRRLGVVVHRTPVHRSVTLDERVGAAVHLKCESFQRAGAFKFRGACNALIQMDPARREAGVLTHSSGNHGQALALAASILRARATVVMPEDAPAVKRAAAEGYGARIVPCRAVDREAVAEALIAEEGLTLVHPYDDPDLIAGQGTAAWELFDVTGPLDLLVVPVGGGGLISGSALAAAARSPGCRVVGVEPATAADAGRSWRDGRIHVLDTVPDTLADGLRTRSIGRHNLAVMRRHVHDMVSVSDAQIRDALRFLWLRMKLVVEPSGAVALAALLTGGVPATGRRVGVIVSGGNVDPAALPALLSD
jgi:threo-3-hydroxy-L-aspartate ammonia-lyase